MSMPKKTASAANSSSTMVGKEVGSDNDIYIIAIGDVHIKAKGKA